MITWWTMSASTSSPPPVTCYDMAGVMMYTWSVFRLNPRGAMDLTYCGGGNMPPIIYGMGAGSSSGHRYRRCDRDRAHAVDATAVSSVDLYYAIDGGSRNQHGHEPGGRRHLRGRDSCPDGWR